VASSHILGPSRSPPNNIRPRNPPSKANANTPSAASRLPNTLPTNREYCDQFIPNANSWTSPVAMPNANTSPYTFTQKTEACRQTGSPVRTCFHAIQTKRIPSPIEMGGKMKWKLAVRANWSRDRNSGFTWLPLPSSRERACLPGHLTAPCAAEHHADGMIPGIPTDATVRSSRVRREESWLRRTPT
jgi:hypothetical protein